MSKNESGSRNSPPTDSVWKSLRKLWELLNTRIRIRGGIMLGILVIQAVLETVGVGTVPAVAAALAEPDRLFGHPLVGPHLRALGIDTQMKLLSACSVGLVGVFLVKTGYAYFAARFEGRFLMRLRVLGTELFSAYMRAPYVFHLQRNPAELTRNATQEVNRCIQKVIEPLLVMAASAFIGLCTLALMLVVEPLITVVSVVLFGTASYGYLALTRKRATAFGRLAQKHRAMLLKAVNQGLGGFKEAHILAREPEFIRAFAKSNRRQAEALEHHLVASKMIGPGLELVAVLGLATIVALLLLSGREGGSIIPLLAFFAAALLRLRAALARVVATANLLQYEHVSIEPLYRDMKELGRVGALPETAGVTQRLPLEHCIELKHVGFKYPRSDAWVLKDVNLRIPRGSCVAFVGTTGAGKSTLADMILGVLRPEQGTILVDGVDVHQDIRRWQSNLGYIPQALYLMDDTLRRNIAFGVAEKDIDDARVRTAARMAQLDEVLSGLPDGFETLLGDRGIRLSGGQRQRVCIARALYHDPEVLILDEATSALDNLTEKRVVEELESHRGERTLIIVAHRLTTVQRCDQIYLFRNGTLEASGTYAELSQLNRTFQDLSAAEA